jgi:hypothetical protein
MKWTNHLSIILLLALSTVLQYCGTEEASDASPDELLGRWELTNATRNGRPTESLTDLYFEFFLDGKMTTNIGGTTENASYTLNDDEIRQTDSQFDVTYEIQDLQDSTLVLATELRGYSFRFRLAKAIQEE